VVSVDTKKKELIGAFRNAGRTWRAEGAPHRVFTHDFPHLGVGKAIPYGTYDLTQDQAVVNVGVTHDTAEFAVESIRRWWRLMGQRSYPAARRLLVCADAGVAVCYTSTIRPRRESGFLHPSGLDRPSPQCFSGNDTVETWKPTAG
jgi:hypothetical protein